METVDEYLRLAEEAEKANAHVASSTYYRNAIEGMGYTHCAAPSLLKSIKNAQRLKKNEDRKAIADWGQDALERVKPEISLERTINLELAELRTSVK